VRTLVDSRVLPTRSTGPTEHGTVTRKGGVRGRSAPTTVSSLTPTGSRLPAREKGSRETAGTTSSRCTVRLDVTSAGKLTVPSLPTFPSRVPSADSTRTARACEPASDGCTRSLRPVTVCGEA
jgi:hypothetical protein